jgi:predicted  nucleic acid-binding Zn-ribbon protein
VDAGIAEQPKELIVPDQQVEAEAPSRRDIQSLEESLQRLWEKARQVSELLLRVREDNRQLRQKVAELESKERHLSASLQISEGELERARAEVVKIQSNGSGGFTKEEREALKSRIKDLIARINARL